MSAEDGLQSLPKTSTNVSLGEQFIRKRMEKGDDLIIESILLILSPSNTSKWPVRLFIITGPAKNFIHVFSVRWL